MPTIGNWSAGELEPVNEGKASVVLGQTGIMMGAKIRTSSNMGIEVRMAKINVLILDSRAPVLAESVL
jgi:hypothetical protein